MRKGLLIQTHLLLWQQLINNMIQQHWHSINKLELFRFFSFLLNSTAIFCKIPSFSKNWNVHRIDLSWKCLEISVLFLCVIKDKNMTLHKSRSCFILFPRNRRGSKWIFEEHFIPYVICLLIFSEILIGMATILCCSRSGWHRGWSSRSRATRGWTRTNSRTTRSTSSYSWCE